MSWTPGHDRNTYHDRSAYAGNLASTQAYTEAYGLDPTYAFSRVPEIASANQFTIWQSAFLEEPRLQNTAASVSSEDRPVSLTYSSDNLSLYATQNVRPLTPLRPTDVPMITVDSLSDSKQPSRFPQTESSGAKFRFAPPWTQAHVNANKVTKKDETSGACLSCFIKGYQCSAKDLPGRCSKCTSPDKYCKGPVSIQSFVSLAILKENASSLLLRLQFAGLPNASVDINHAGIIGPIDKERLCIPLQPLQAASDWVFEAEVEQPVLETTLRLLSYVRKTSLPILISDDETDAANGSLRSLQHNFSQFSCCLALLRGLGPSAIDLDQLDPMSACTAMIRFGVAVCLKAEQILNSMIPCVRDIMMTKRSAARKGIRQKLGAVAFILGRIETELILLRTCSRMQTYHPLNKCTDQIQDCLSDISFYGSGLNAEEYNKGKKQATLDAPLLLFRSNEDAVSLQPFTSQMRSAISAKTLYDTLIEPSPPTSGLSDNSLETFQDAFWPDVQFHTRVTQNLHGHPQQPLAYSVNSLSATGMNDTRQVIEDLKAENMTLHMQLLQLSENVTAIEAKISQNNTQILALSQVSEAYTFFKDEDFGISDESTLPSDTRWPSQSMTDMTHLSNTHRVSEDSSASMNLPQQGSLQQNSWHTNDPNHSQNVHAQADHSMDSRTRKRRRISTTPTAHTTATTNTASTIRPFPPAPPIPDEPHPGTPYNPSANPSTSSNIHKTSSAIGGEVQHIELNESTSGPSTPVPINPLAQQQLTGEKMGMVAGEGKEDVRPVSWPERRVRRSWRHTVKGLVKLFEKLDGS